MSLPNSPQANGGRVSWQEQLGEYCRRAKIEPPVFHIVSDRRGGRTAWSSSVTVQGRNIAARYWYDGQYINNAKEDAAEVAIKQINPAVTGVASTLPGQLFRC
ncbi:hypothetical protein EYZ11_008742 [Aspergillus tanneri]|uniref:DRBM domain-containing protein n=1 Tax=Aspergillus tanneri TaxID=1220188 RepID=A0A4S3J9U9_9EURO|nr:uncharacterized protein ATNIH1004_002761 [Aspergillus tanneri]KAA8650080.1 hypothetical protein ATNIH1004_002761 [Aspergillus tanneri]THC91790.1 hypothetical protein EYZ11_008742 [Aspergillus tanneri]